MLDSQDARVNSPEPNAPAADAWTVGIGLLSHVGMVRAENQDAFAYHEPDTQAALAERGRLLVVCDGMGGHYGGSVASRSTVDGVVAKYFDPEFSAPDPGTRLLGSLQAANTLVRNKGRERPELRQMGTTCVAIALIESRLHIAHIGDSRIYRLRGRSVQALTRDHTYVNDLVEMGVLEPEEAAHHPQRHVITRCIGMADEVRIDQFDEEVRVGDVFLLCSDGLYQHVEDKELGNIVRAHEPQVAAQKLVDLANERGGEDNITVGILELEAEGSDGSNPRADDAEDQGDGFDPASGTKRAEPERLLAFVLIAECIAVALLLALIRWA